MGMMKVAESTLICEDENDQLSKQLLNVVTKEHDVPAREQHGWNLDPLFLVYHCVLWTLFAATYPISLSLAETRGKKYLLVCRYQHSGCEVQEKRDVFIIEALIEIRMEMFSFL